MLYTCVAAVIGLLLYPLFPSWGGSISGVIADDSGTAASLYPFDFPLLQLTGDNFTSNVYGQKYSVFAQFYSSYCGHCINFMPKWTKFVFDVKEWDRIVKPASINCALSVNRELCAEQDIIGTPTIIYFKRDAQSANDTFPYDGQYSWTPHGLAAGLANLVAQDAHQMRRPMGWPRMKPIYALTTLYDLYHAASIRGADKIVLLFEEPGDKDYVGEQITLDFSKQEDVYVATADHTHFLARDYHILDFPGLVLLEPNKSEATFKSKFALTRNEIRDMIIEDFNLDYTISVPPNTEAESDIDTMFNASSVSVHRQDLVSGLSYLLSDEIANHRVVSGEKLTALRKFVAVLAQYFPGGQGTMDLLNFLNDRFQEAEPNHVTNITNSQWKESVDAMKTQFSGSLLDHPRWKACQGSRNRYRGYSCSLWLMFHTLTVEAYEKQGNDPNFDPLEVLRAVRGYVINFFGCSECAKNYRTESADMETEVEGPRDGVLWLWKTHNKVNARLAGDGSEDPVFPKIQFPAEDDCPICKRPDGTFDENEVFNYLLAHYGNIPTSKKR